MKFLIAISATVLALAGPLEAPAQTVVPAPSAHHQVSDEALVKTLPGFRNGYATVNGVRLHYVIGGDGPLVVLLPGWPQTWWSYRKMMPKLAKGHRVVAVDIRGMGTSGRPAGGYDKKTMAKDIRELVRGLGYPRAHIVGHDIGAQVAYSFAANFPESTHTLTMLDVAHPDVGLASWPMLPAHGTFTDKIDPAHAYPWWFAFHQVKGLPEELLEGRHHIHQAWFFRYLAYDERAIDARARAVYAAAYRTKDAIRAGNGWYQAFTQDIEDHKTYARLEMPVLALGGPGYGWLKMALAPKASNLRVIHIKDSGHFIPEEKPEVANEYLIDFLRQNGS